MFDTPLHEVVKIWNQIAENIKLDISFLDIKNTLEFRSSINVNVIQVIHALHVVLFNIFL